MKISENIKAVIFDVDGLMIDSEPTWNKTHDLFLEKYNIVIDEKERASLTGIGLKQLISDLHQRFHLEKSADDLLSEYREIFYKNFSASNASRAIEGVEGVVKYFYENGFHLAIATGGHTESEMQVMLKAFNLLKYFSVIISGDEVNKGKPHPDIFLLTARRFDLDPSRCLVFEDSVNGVLAGKAAGMYVIGVNKDEKVYNQLKEAGADEVFYNISELL
jgi:beta-phosphoglucomutase-like phosphatase (HAD superfamily)